MNFKIDSINNDKYCSLKYINSAALFARQIFDFSKEFGNSGGKKEIFLRSYVASVIFNAVTFLDAMSEELFAEAARPDGGVLRNLSPATRELIVKLSQRQDFAKYSALSKIDLLLITAGRKQAIENESLRDEVAALLQLKAQIAHYQSTLLDAGVASRDVQASPQGQYSDMEHFPGHFRVRQERQDSGVEAMLGHDCAKWAVRSAIAYADEVFRALQAVPYYEAIREDLQLPA